MSAVPFDVDALLKMANSPIRNYAVPGITSSLLGAPAADGSVVRVFESSREQVESVTPHNHRYGFTAYVLRGWVDNVIWKETWTSAEHADMYVRSTLEFRGQSGAYEKVGGTEVKRWSRTTTRYEAGQWYSMTAQEFHSIWFSRGAVVLLFEEPHVSDESEILEPFVDGEVIPNGAHIEPWMFKRGTP